MAQSNSVPPIADVVLAEPPKSQHRQDVVAMATSACLHAIVLVILAVWVIPSLSGGADNIIEVAFGDSDEFSIETLQVSVVAPPKEIAESEMPTAAAVFEFSESEMLLPVAEKPVNVVQQTTTAIASTEISEESLSTSTSVEGAVDRITGELNAKLNEGDLLVVWLLDASKSLVDDRKRVAARLTPFYDGLVDGRHPSSHVLKSAVVSFASSMRERVAPTEFGQRIVASVENLPVDRTGNEKVFDAVAKCAEHYRKGWKNGQLVIVVWTDESGDDVDDLEATIAVCRDNNVNVSVVGPSSVLGADTGLHSYTDPKSKQIYQLDVLRGPDAAKSERLELGYWYLTRFRGAGRGGGLPTWLGGHDLQGILSGFSPYALTRLSMQTGGSYTIFDKPEDRGPFDFKAMLKYAPSYASLRDYEADVQTHPLRLAVSKAVSALQGKKIGPPTTMLFVKSTGTRTFDFMRYYYQPREFQSKLFASRGRLKAQASRSAKIIDEALRHLSKNSDIDTGLEDLHRDETSLRWRAWYDLTRGRLLATSVRLEEYSLTIDAITQQNALATSTNHVLLIWSQNLRADEKFRRRGEEAENLLRRCVYEHRGTPWETLAQRELDYALGIGVREMALTPTGGGPAPRQPNLPRF